MRFAFTDLYPGYEKDLLTNPIFSYFITNPKFLWVTPDNSPDLIICSVFGQEHVKYPEPYKLMWAAENMAPGNPWPDIASFDDIDWAFVDNHQQVVNIPENVKYYYLPYAGVHYNMDQVKSWHAKNLSKPKSKFCCFVSSGNGEGEGYKLRHDFFTILSQAYKHVDSAGGMHNNVGYCAPRGDQYIDWVSDYKFMICFENTQGAGYFSEKIFTPYAAGTIPIYWGDQTNFEIVRKEACLFYTTPEDTLARIVKADLNSTYYQSILNQDLFSSDKDRPDVLSRKYITTILDKIVTEIKS